MWAKNNNFTFGNLTHWVPPTGENHFRAIPPPTQVSPSRFPVLVPFPTPSKSGMGPGNLTGSVRPLVRRLCDKAVYSCRRKAAPQVSRWTC